MGLIKSSNHVHKSSYKVYVKTNKKVCIHIYKNLTNLPQLLKII